MTKIDGLGGGFSDQIINSWSLDGSGMSSYKSIILTASREVIRKILCSWKVKCQKRSTFYLDHFLRWLQHIG